MEWKKYFTTRNILIAVLMLILYVLFSDLAKAFIFLALFTPLGLLSVRTTKFIPHIGVETITACSFFLGYLYGWPIGVIFGVFIGGYIWSTAAGLSQFVMLNLLLDGVAAVLGSFFFGMHIKFVVAYTIGMSIRNIMSYFLAMLIGANPMENMMHLISDFAWNTLIFAQLIFVMYDVAMLF